MSALLARRTILAAAASLTACSVVPDALASPGPIPRRSGLPWASGAFGEMDGVSSLRGFPLDVAHFYLKRTSWADIAAAGGLAQMAGRQETIIVSYPMFPNRYSPKTAGREAWRRGADGAFDLYHNAAAEALARYDRPLIFRIGWEWNNRGFPWSTLDDADAGAYRTYFQRIVTALRARTGCWIDWSCDKEGRTDADVRRWYPGGTYVDFIGPNMYDFWPAITSRTVWDRAYRTTRLGGPKGMGSWLDYAREQGKLLSCGEWGLIGPNPAGGGDNPVFIETMLRFFAENAPAIAYDAYFNRNVSPNIHRLANYPRAAARYRSVMAELT
jgi:hypothetical protein